MQDIMGLEFKNDVDVHIVSVNPRSFATPVVIKSGFTPEEFINVLTHELIHILHHKGEKKLTEIWRHAQSLYTTDSDQILVHYILYVIMDEIWRRIGKKFEFINPYESEVNKEYSRAKQLAQENPQYILDKLAEIK